MNKIIMIHVWSVIVSPGSECEELTAAMLESLPPRVRSNIKLTDLNTFYQQLQQHLGKSNRLEKNSCYCEKSKLVSEKAWLHVESGLAVTV